MDDQPLAGYSLRVLATSPASNLAGAILRDLGAVIDRSARSGEGDIVDRGARVRPGGVILSPYGPTGRFADAPALHSAVEAVAGAHVAQYSYSPGPVYLVSPYSSTAQGLLAVAALLGARVGGGAEARHVSALQGLLAIQSGFYAFGSEYDPTRFAHTPRGQTPFYSTYRAADGWMFFGGLTTAFMIKVLQTTGLDDLLADPRLQEGPRALRDADLAREMWERIGRVIAERPRDHWLATFESAKIPAGPVLSPQQALAHPHLRAAGLTEPDVPIDRLRHPVRVTRRGDAPFRPAAAQGPLPLSGVRVVELAGYIAGPYIGRLLADLGASVVKIEPVDGDPFRSSGYGFAAWNSGKRSLALDLRSEAGRARVLELVRDADVLLTNYRPEALDRMRLGREEMFALNPALIHCTLSAFGETGPLAQLQGFDPVVQAFAGIMDRQGGDDEPVKPQMAATDYLAGTLGAIGVLAARLAQRERGGGYVVQTSLLAAASLLNFEMYEAIRAERTFVRGGRDFKGPHPLNALHEARDGWLLTALPEGRPGDFPDALHFLTGPLRGRSVEDALEALTAHGVPAVPALRPEDLPEDPHFAANGLWLSAEEHGLGVVTRPAPVVSGGAGVEPAPMLGEHNALSEIWSSF